MDESIKIIFVVGHTASGKSNWAIQQAQKYNGCLVNCDSVQFYQGLQIGSAAPSLSDQALVPHHLYSYVQAPDEMTAGNFLRDFYNLVENKKLKSPVFVVGGTGFYIQALEKGMYDIEPLQTGLREGIEKELSEKGAQSLYDELKMADPETFIHVNDHFRLVRAIEILRHNGQTPSALKKQSHENKNKNSLPFPYIKIGFSYEKEQALAQVQKRTQWMIQNGLVDETKSFLPDFKEWAPLSSVGYKETVEYLLNNKSIEWLQDNMNQSTMKLIKKQKTWFKRDSTILWSDNSAESLKKIDNSLDQFLK